MILYSHSGSFQLLWSWCGKNCLQQIWALASGHAWGLECFTECLLCNVRSLPSRRPWMFLFWLYKRWWFCFSGGLSFEVHNSSCWVQPFLQDTTTALRFFWTRNALFLGAGWAPIVLAPIIVAVINLLDIVNDDNFLFHVKRSVKCIYIQPDLWVGRGKNCIQQVRTFIKWTCLRLTVHRNSKGLAFCESSSPSFLVR